MIIIEFSRPTGDRWLRTAAEARLTPGTLLVKWKPSDQWIQLAYVVATVSGRGKLDRANPLVTEAVATEWMVSAPELATTHMVFSAVEIRTLPCGAGG